MASPRAGFYIDGFNLYNGCLVGSPYKWLDLEVLAGQLAPHAAIHVVHYFTARVDGAKARRQDVYLRALGTLGPVFVHDEGHFETHTVTRPLATTPAPKMAAVLESSPPGTWHQPPGPWVPLPHPAPGHDVRASVRDTKEKGTDVNLASYLISEALTDAIEEAYVVSGDSDLELPVSMAAAKIPVHVINPKAGWTSQRLQAAATSYTTMNVRLLANSQLPPAILLRTGQYLTKPRTW